MAIERGKLTFDAEGMEGGFFHSRRLHVPTPSSGLTIGRGYDMKEKTPARIRKDLMAAGVSSEAAEKLSEAAGLFGDTAKRFITDEKFEAWEISPSIQEKLFQLSYADMQQDVARICGKADCVTTYGTVDWDALDPAIIDVLVDLRFRGDYTPEARQRIQRHVCNNDFAAFAQELCRAANWSKVPNDRFQRRVDHVKAELTRRASDRVVRA